MVTILLRILMILSFKKPHKFEEQNNSETILTLSNTAAEIINCTFVTNQFGTAIFMVSNPLFY